MTFFVYFLLVMVVFLTVCCAYLLEEVKALRAHTAATYKTLIQLAKMQKSGELRPNIPPPPAPRKGPFTPKVVKND